MAGIFSLYCK